MKMSTCVTPPTTPWRQGHISRGKTGGEGRTKRVAQKHEQQKDEDVFCLLEKTVRITSLLQGESDRLSLESLRDFQNTWGEELRFCVDVLLFQAQRKHHGALDLIAMRRETSHLCKVLFLSLIVVTAYISKY